MKKNWKKFLVGTLCLLGFLLLLGKVNQFEKVPLISTEGQSYEKAIVTKITKDNLAAQAGAGPAAHRSASAG